MRPLFLREDNIMEIKGIDVSSWQGLPDWKKIKAEILKKRK